MPSLDYKEKLEQFEIIAKDIQSLNKVLNKHYPSWFTSELEKLTSPRGDTLVTESACLPIRAAITLINTLIQNNEKLQSTDN